MFNLKSKIIPTPPYNKAFTLAEVLITLVIIGVIAAITVPTLIIKHQKEETVTRLKKIYTTMSQAVKLSEIDNGLTDNWDYNLSAEDFYNTYLKKYIINAKDFGFIDMNTSGVTYKKLNNEEMTSGYILFGNNYRIVLNDGSMIMISPKQSDVKSRLIFVDINGFNKPNKFGRDVFLFQISSKYKFSPFGLGEEAFRSFGNVANRNVLLGNEQEACKTTRYGGWCAALIMTDGWQIKDDYPW
ncbi:prepilin-type N-terminal cleavage/methylation domain-containing protein [bacterium]|nr:prepilin-type N-terminal cleavage/methylation domain-containing protein [bacterium]